MILFFFPSLSMMILFQYMVVTGMTSLFESCRTGFDGKWYIAFYSQKGYVLYNQQGKLLDSHSLFQLNKGKKEQSYKLAYPLDSNSILYYQEIVKDSPVVYIKKLYKKDLKKISDDKSGLYSNIHKSVLFNIASNSITDEMSNKTFFMPHLLGFTALNGGIKWWTTDKLYSFTSPIIVEQDQKYLSFFQV